MSHLNLVPLARELVFDDTMREVRAVMRFDAKLDEDDTKVQLLIDLRHKKNARRSKPRFYGTMSEPRQFENLITASIAMSCFHRLRRKENITKDDILYSYDEIVKWIRPDVAVITEALFRDVRKKTK